MQCSVPTSKQSLSRRLSKEFSPTRKQLFSRRLKQNYLLTVNSLLVDHRISSKSLIKSNFTRNVMSHFLVPLNIIYNLYFFIFYVIWYTCFFVYIQVNNCTQKYQPESAHFFSFDHTSYFLVLGIFYGDKDLVNTQKVF